MAAGLAGPAADVFREVLSASPTDVAASTGLGDAELARDNYRGARTAFEQAARLDPTNQIVREKAALCERVLALDPTARGLRSAERYQRSVELLKGALTGAEACLPVSAGDPSAEVERARQVLASSRRPPSFGEATDENVRLAERLWAHRAPRALSATQPSPRC